MAVMTPQFSPALQALLAAVEPERNALLAHPVYAFLRSMEDLRRFMEIHAFAVWDFMSLLKALQAKLTCIDVPWLPTSDPEVRALVNAIVMGEESDVTPDGRHRSHFELYRDAMISAGADTAPIAQLPDAVRRGVPWREALAGGSLPAGARDFVRYSLETAETGPIHVVAAVFTFGREDVIPGMFTRLIGDLRERFPDQLADFHYYLQRHIDLDGDDHGPMSLRMMEHVCGGDPQAWAEATEAALKSLALRRGLWDAVLAR
jgi:hypothetical protein